MRGGPIKRPRARSRLLILVIFIATAIVYIVTALGAGHATGRLPLAAKLSVKPRADNRSYQFGTLRNGIRAVNVQDNGRKQRAFAVAANAGSSQDPTQFPGLARDHACQTQGLLADMHAGSVPFLDGSMGKLVTALG